MDPRTLLDLSAGPGAPASPRSRDDLEFIADRVDEDFVYVKDPLRSQYYRFNLMQVEMMRLLDGRATAEQIADRLGEDFGAEIDAEQVERFVERLRRLLLLDATCYEAGPGRARALVRRALARRGLDPGPGRDPLRFVARLDEALDADPADERARRARRAAHEAFFRAHRETPRHLVMVPLLDPDRALSALDRLCGRFIFGPWGVAAFVACLLAAVPALLESSFPQVESFGWLDAVYFAALVVPLAFIHEGAHGLACKHYGGRVNDMGFLLFYGVVPGAYCDVNDSYTFASRRHKIVVQLAGTLGELAALALLVIVYWLSAEGFFLRRAIFLIVGWRMFSVFENLVPFVQKDGYYALADYLAVPNLRDRSLRYVGDLLKRRLLGIEAGAAAPSERERRIFVTFGFGAALYTVAYVYGLWISLLLPLAIQYLHGVGVLLSAAYAGSRVLAPAVRAAVRWARLVWEHRRAVVTARRVLAYAAVATLVTFGATRTWPELIDGSAVIHPHRRAVVSALEPGLVISIAAREGDRVEAGQALAQLRSDELEHVRASAEANLERAQLALALTEAGRRPEDIAHRAAGEAVAAASSLGAQAVLERARLLGHEALLAFDAAEGLHRRAVAAGDERSLSASDLDLARAGSRPEDVVRARASLRAAQERLADANVRLDRLTLRAPMAGIVVGARVEEHELRHLGAGEVLAEIADTSEVYAEVAVPSVELWRDVGRGQDVALRARGGPHRPIATKVSAVEPRAAPGGDLRVRTDAFANPGLPLGATGHARIYGAPRSIAFLAIGAPLLRLADYRTWWFWG
jgi:putative peptide zinc metalloprotease protein